MPLGDVAGLDAGWLETHLPHRGRMCLLAHVLDWDEERIRCLCTGHRDPEHPLRAHGRLGIAAGIELGSQAMAAHGALTGAAAGAGGAVDADGRARFGMLASLRAVHFEALRLDDIAADLICSARRLAGDGASALYEFTLTAADRTLLTGRATVVLDAAAAGAAAAGAAAAGAWARR